MLKIKASVEHSLRIDLERELRAKARIEISQKIEADKDFRTSIKNQFIVNYRRSAHEDEIKYIRNELELSKEYGKN